MIKRPAVASTADINSTESAGENPETAENLRPVNQTNEPESHHVGGFRQWWTDLLEVGLGHGYESTYYFTSQAILGNGHSSPREIPLACSASERQWISPVTLYQPTSVIK